jgi:hypothetical protein
MFLVLAVVLAALLMRRWWAAVLLPLLGALPLAVFGLYSLAHGALWLPNPVVVKSDLYDIHSLYDFLALITGPKLSAFLSTTAVMVPVLLALLGVVVDAAGKNAVRSRERLFVLIVVLTAGMHLFGAAAGWFTRYEAYLVFLGVLVAGVAWQPLLDGASLRLHDGDRTRSVLLKACVLLLQLVLVAPVAQRVSSGLGHARAAAKNIHDQQVQMGRFLGRYYGDDVVVINDLGAVAFYSKVRPVDISALATVEVTRASIARPTQRTTAFLDELARHKGARIAVIHTSCMPGGKVPDGWVKVGTWTVSHNIICGDENLDFYALDRDAGQLLEANLRDFASSLPGDIRQAGRYTRTPGTALMAATTAAK